MVGWADTNPKVIFADEPTGNLDTATGALVEDILFTLNRERGITLVIVTHDVELAERCDRQIFIRDGHLQSESHQPQPEPHAADGHPLTRAEAKARTKVQP